MRCASAVKSTAGTHLSLLFFSSVAGKGDSSLHKDRWDYLVAEFARIRLIRSGTGNDGIGTWLNIK